MKRLFWRGGPGNIFSADGITLAHGESVEVEDDLADRLLTMHRSLNAAGENEIGRLDTLHEEGAPASREDAMIAKAEAGGATESPAGAKVVHHGSAEAGDQKQSEAQKGG